MDSEVAREREATALALEPGRVGEGGIPGSTARGRSPWVLFAVIAVGLFMAAMDQTIVATALPTLRRELRTNLSWSAWTITIYSLGSLISMPMLGRFADLYGRRRTFVWCLAIFTIASLGCGLAPDIGTLLPLRLIQAIGGGGFMPSATGIVSDAFKDRRDRAIGLFTSIYPIGSLAGPVFGGVIVTYWSWREIFFVNVPVGLALLVAARRMLPRDVARGGRARPDYGGSAQIAVFTAALMVGLTYIGYRGSSLLSPPFLVPEAVAVGTVWLIGRHSKRHDTPIIPIHFLRDRRYLLMNVLNLVYGGSVMGIATLVPLYAQERFGIRALPAAMLLAARAGGAIFVAAATACLLRRVGYRLPMITGYLLVVVGFAGLGLVAPPGRYWLLALAASLTGIGNGMAAPATNNAVLSMAPGDVAAVAGLRAAFRQLGGIFGISLTTALTARSTHPGAILAHCFVAFAIAIALSTPLIFFVPERKKDW